MNIITTIEYLAAMMVGFYLIGLLMVWIYEFKRNAIYKKMQEKAKNLEQMHLSMAVTHAKAYKIMQDYRRDSSAAERVQQFILENVLLIRRSTLKSE
ncbi:MAG: hypothetical protein US57_C0002G0068 [Candidatus Moranbacteria bacterium GW2011_GWC2_37_73]|nr:MAG: hypothetical protein UR95_C0002G0165 [Parcubacteria group bacterium GW2011_GWC1_36_108]KKQ00421.1 MAG: hypothetical protein US09_C0012G0008 [Candidatus Moranbacteria bacterium GW2011_GWD1_36_198]KKQ01623.1 MAG: hypothetical protein US10_C0010G0008 [Candidatus Moranbacteria bacterium GW2011_GWD2_36_198]KKQ40361.1 MAG: hypothetical protein US57_C0002G0068 [Candidatus Moranbacteria bacterium GW2011_GWC2_37_73]HBI50857.1 hypothetical protein [Candidatus Moranbacteria bacterium]